MAKKKKQPRALKYSKKIAQPQRRILLPPQVVLRPTSPYERRMADYAVRVPLPGTPEAARLQKLMEMDVAFQMQFKELKRRLPYLVSARVRGGSGLPLSNLLRWYFVENLNRYFTFGPESLPSSFNVVESFMFFNREYMFFDLRDEKEHLLNSDDYFTWYEHSGLPRKPHILEDIMAEGIIYSYEMICDAGGPRISGESQQVLAGVSFVRHAHELSALLLAGENPPLDSDDEVTRSRELMEPSVGRERIVADPALTTQDRYLQGYDGYAKVIVLTRFDLRADKHDVRYVFLDGGPSFRVFTDDASLFEDMPPDDAEKHRREARAGLLRYDDLFAALASMIYLPAFFVASADQVQDLLVSTQLHARRQERAIRRTVTEVGRGQCCFQRTILCMPMSIVANRERSTRVQPPEMEFNCDGYWKPLQPQQFGEDKDGKPIVGRTWVSRHETWSARSPQSFMLTRKMPPQGANPGIVYIQRSPAHAIDIYKVGLTRRSSEARASELSAATGVPLPFDILASWEVGDCGLVEHEVHRALARFRINPRREFFHADLSLISRTIQSVIDRTAGSASEPNSSEVQ